MGFFKSLFKIAKTVAPIAIGFIPGIGVPAAAALGAAAGAVGGGGIKGALLGGLTAGAGNYINAAGGIGNVLKGLTGAPIDITSSAGGVGTGGLLTNGISAATGGGGNILNSLINSPSNLLTAGNVAGSIYSATSGAAAAKKAANLQAQGIDQAIAANEPYTTAGKRTVNNLSNLVNDPAAQADFINNNPFFGALATKAKNDLFSNAAASGKLGSGGTLDALQNSYLLLGNQLLQQDIQNKQNLTNTGQAATNNLIDLVTSKGAVKAAGAVGASNAKTGAINNALRTQTSLYGIDKGVKLQ